MNLTEEKDIFEERQEYGVPGLIPGGDDCVKILLCE